MSNLIDFVNFSQTTKSEYKTFGEKKHLWDTKNIL